MKTIYHLVFADETVTFLDEESKAAFIDKVAPNMTEVLHCTSEITDEEYDTLGKMSSEESSGRTSID
jgi:hypothetical protein